MRSGASPDAACFSELAVGLIYKIMPEALWRASLEAGVFEGAPVDHADGFIHFSTGGQVRETAARHFPGQDNLLLGAVEAEDLGLALRWEPSRDGTLFPHLYGPLPVSLVRWTAPLPWDPKLGHRFPDQLE